MSGRWPTNDTSRRVDFASRCDGIVRAPAVGSPRRGRGYTLIEVLVAFAVLALALTVLLGTLAGATRQVRWSADSGRAALHAQSLVAQVGVGEVLVAGSRGGELDAGRYRWLLEVEPWMDPQAPAAPLSDPFGAQMMALRLTVEWGEGGPRERLVVESLRLVADREGTL